MHNKSRNNQWSLSTIFSLVAAAILITALIFFSIRITDIKKSAIADQLQQNSHVIESNYSEILDYTSHVMGYMASQIKQNGTEDHYIYGLLDAFKAASENVMPWSTFSWLNDKQLLTITSNRGFMPHPVNLSNRDYIPKTIAQPYKFFLGSLVIGSTSQLWIIPAGMGVADRSGRYLGTIISGFAIGGMTEKLETAINHAGVDFILLSSDRRIVTKSNHIKSDNVLLSLLPTLLPESLSAGQSGVFSTPSLLHPRAPFAYYQVMEKYPYIIITTFDQSLSSALLMHAIMEFIEQCLVIAAIIILLLVIIRKLLIYPIVTLSSIADDLSKNKISRDTYRFYSAEINNLLDQLLKLQSFIEEEGRIKQTLAEAVRIAKESFEAKEDFMSKVKYDLQTPLDYIIGCSEMVMAHLQKDRDIAMDNPTLLVHLQMIHEAGLQLKSRVIHIVSVSVIDVAALVTECVKTMQLQSFIVNNIVIETDIQAELPPFYTDEVRFKQIIIALIFRAIEFNDHHGKIIIRVNTQLNDDGAKFLSIIIIDNGLGFSEEERRKRNGPAAKNISRRSDGTDLELEDIQRLVRMLKGSLHLESVFSKGTTATITLPYLQKEELENNDIESESLLSDNIVSLDFSKKNKED